jgi:hypothetical protein
MLEAAENKFRDEGDNQHRDMFLAFPWVTDLPPGKDPFVIIGRIQTRHMLARPSFLASEASGGWGILFLLLQPPIGKPKIQSHTTHKRNAQPWRREAHHRQFHKSRW